jgi:hypothetical protein
MSRPLRLVLPITLLFGCGSSVTFVAAGGGDKKTPGVAAQRPVVFPARELAKVLDVGALPALEGTKFFEKTKTSLGAAAPGKLADVTAFYIKLFASRGWEKVELPGSRPINDEYGSIHLTKDGHIAQLIVSKDSGKKAAPTTNVNIQFHGNFDTRTLPRRGPKLDGQLSQVMTSFLSESSALDEAKAIAKALKELGWQEYASFNPPQPERKDHASLSFRKQGYLLSASIATAPRIGKTGVTYWVRTLEHELPAPPDAVKVQFSDGDWKMVCESPGAVKAVAEFYKRAMPEVGFKLLPGEEPQANYWNLRFGDEAGDVVMVELVSRDANATKVSMQGISAATLAAIAKQKNAK